MDNNDNNDDNLASSLERLRGTYDFIKLLGAGNFSRMFLVRHKCLQKELSLKVLEVNRISRILEERREGNIEWELEEIKNQFLHETGVIKEIQHPNIVQVDEIGVLTEKDEKIQLPYFTMGFIKGITLRDRIKSDRGLNLRSVLSISEDILSALQAIHEKNIVYWDFKPRNIIIEEKTGKAVLINISAPKEFLCKNRISYPCKDEGTHPYIAPEQILPDKIIGPRTDIYSVGVVFFEMLTGELPFKGLSDEEIYHQHLKAPVPDVRRLNPALPKGIDAVIKKAMAKDPGKRFPSIEAFKKEFENLLKKTEPALYDRDLYEVMMDLGNTYEVESALKKEVGVSKVYRVKHRGLDSQQVLKIIKYEDFPGKGENEPGDSRKKYLEEGRRLAGIKHENTASIHDLGITWPNHIPYYVREYIEGKRLNELIKEKASLSFDEALKIAGDVLSLLGKMHNNPSPIIHKNIKPSNIIIEKETGKAILIDFGIAEDKLNEIRLSPSGTYQGTPEYMSPEQCNGMRDLDAAADIYSFGVVLYEMLSGEVPFKREDNKPLDIMYKHSYFPVPNIREKNPGLPPGIETVISKAMAKKPKERFKDAYEFLDALKELKDPTEKIKSQIQKITLRKHSVKYLILIPLVLIVLTVVFFISSGKKGGTEQSQAGVVNFRETLQPVQESGERKTIESNTEKIREKVGRIKAALQDVLQDSSQGANENGRIEKYYGYLDKRQKIPGNVKPAMMEPGKGSIIGKVEQAKKVELKFEIFNDLMEPEYKTVDIYELKRFLNDNKKKKSPIDIYLEFKKEYPNSSHLNTLKNILKSKDPNLPPEKYWTKSTRKNVKGYYESEFCKEQNRHIMIYIPEKEIWVDKY